MTKSVASDSDEDVRGFFDFAFWLWKDGTRLKAIREELGLTKKVFAEQAGISVRKLDGYERPGEMAGNLWLFCHDLRQLVIHYPDEWKKQRKAKKDRMKGGGIGDRDNWYEWSGPKLRKFRRWAHRKYIEKMSDDERQQPRTRGEIEGWFKEWDKLKRKKQDAYEIVKPMKKPVKKK